jgi:putative membrane protein insertion efficiency factor
MTTVPSGTTPLNDAPLRTPPLVTRLLRTVAVAPIRLYQLLVSPFLPANTCKYHPSCSEYAALAIRKHGLLRGVPMAGWRLLRCNPWSHGGVDYP